MGVLYKRMEKHLIHKCFHSDLEFDLATGLYYNEKDLKPKKAQKAENERVPTFCQGLRKDFQEEKERSQRRHEQS